MNALTCSWGLRHFNFDLFTFFFSFLGKCPFFDTKKERMDTRQCQGQNCPSEEIYSLTAVKCNLTNTIVNLISKWWSLLHIFNQNRVIR